MSFFKNKNVVITNGRVTGGGNFVSSTINVSGNNSGIIVGVNNSVINGDMVGRVVRPKDMQDIKEELQVSAKSITSVCVRATAATVVIGTCEIAEDIDVSLTGRYSGKKPTIKITNVSVFGGLTISTDENSGDEPSYYEDMVLNVTLPARNYNGINIETVSGAILASFKDNAVERFTVESTSGEISVDAPTDEMKAETISGDIFCCGTSRKISAKSTSGDVRLVHANAPEEIKVKTTSGDINVSIKGKYRVLNYDLDTMTGSKMYRVHPTPESNAIVYLTANSVSGDIYVNN